MCNLYVKGFHYTYDENRLWEIFGQYGEIESIRILPTYERQTSSRAFVCFKLPECAAQARVQLNGLKIDGKILFVAKYELPENRRKLQANVMDKADFYYKRN